MSLNVHTKWDLLHSFFDSGDRSMAPMLFPGTNPSLPSHIPIQMAAAPAQGYASSIVSTGPFPTAVIQNTGSRPMDPQNIGTRSSQNIFPISSHSLGLQANQTVFPPPLVSQACGSGGICSTSSGNRITHTTVFPTLGTGGGIRQTLPTHYYTSGSGSPHLALPMSPNLIHMSGKLPAYISHDKKHLDSFPFSIDMKLALINYNYQKIKKQIIL